MNTIADIAKETGYSLMTVSRALNSPEKVKPETRSKILAAAERLNYRPNNVARSLALKRTNIIFVYIPKELSATEQFVSQTVTAIGERLGKRGYSFLLSRSLPVNESFDGIIVMGLSEKEQTSVLQSEKIDKPIVLYGNSDDFSAWVDVDNYNGEALIVEYLVEKGYKRIAAVAAPQYMHYAIERLNAYKDVLKRHSVDVDENLIEIDDVNEKGGYDCTKRLLERNRDIDAIVCATDTMAIGCIRAIREMGLSVPKDIAVVGFDGFGHENIASPKLTTVKQPLFEVGEKLADVLMEIISGKEPQQIKILPTLIIGESA